MICSETPFQRSRRTVGLLVPRPLRERRAARGQSGFHNKCPFGQHRRETGRRQAATPAWMAGGRWCTRIAETRPSTGRVASHTVAPKVLCATNAFRARSSSNLSLDPGACGVLMAECQRVHAKCASRCQERRCTYCRRSGTSVEACGASRDCSPDAVSGSRRAVVPPGVQSCPGPWIASLRAGRARVFQTSCVQHSHRAPKSSPLSQTTAGAAGAAARAALHLLGHLHFGCPVAMQ